MNKPYDLTYLDQVFQGNSTLVGQIVTLFLQQAPQLSQRMVSAVEAKQWGDLHPLAHKLKISVKMLGLREVLPVVVEIERVSKHREEPSVLPHLVGVLLVSLRHACDALSDEWVGQQAGTTRWPVLRRA